MADVWFWAGWGAAAVLLAVWMTFAFRAKAGPLASLVGVAHLGVAALHVPMLASAAINGLGRYEFGVLQASGGWGVALAGAVLVIALVGAFNALGANKRARMRTAAASLLFLVNLGGAWLHGLATDVRADDLGAALLIALIIAPFFLGTVWAGRRALSAV